MAMVDFTPTARWQWQWQMELSMMGQSGHIGHHAVRPWQK